MKRRLSLACRKCHRGWWGTVGERCKGCGELAALTGRIAVVPLRPPGGKR